MTIPLKETMSNRGINNISITRNDGGRIMAEITELMKSYKETRVAPSTMSTIYSSDRAAVNCVVLITKQTWEDVVKSLIEQAHYRGNMPSYRTCITDLFRKSGFTPIRYGGRVS